MWLNIAASDTMSRTILFKTYLAFCDTGSTSDEQVFRATSKDKKPRLRQKKRANFLFTFQRDLYFIAKSSGVGMKAVEFMLEGATVAANRELSEKPF